MGSTDRGMKKIDITCGALKGNQIDWDCVFGPGSLKEVYERGGDMTTCKEATKSEPCSRFIVPKEEERAEVKIKEGPEGFPFLKNEKYIFRYSVKAKKGMRVAKKYTHLGQLKGSKGGEMLKGDPIFSLTANLDGLMVRFSNRDSTENFHPGLKKHLDWDKATGGWVHVKITTVFGQSMEVQLSGAVNGKAVWPKNLKPVAWLSGSEMVRMKLGLYHSKGNVYDQEVIYKNISIEGPNGTIRTGNKPSKADGKDKPDGYTYKGCFRDSWEDRVFVSKSTSDSMTTEKCAKDCKGSELLATQYGSECWCGDSKTEFNKHGKAECNQTCSGAKKDGEKCGGKFAMSVYQVVGGGSSTSADGARSLGGFSDNNDSGSRSLSLDSETSEGMAHEGAKSFGDLIDSHDDDRATTLESEVSASMADEAVESFGDLGDSHDDDHAMTPASKGNDDNSMTHEEECLAFCSKIDGATRMGLEYRHETLLLREEL